MSTLLVVPTMVIPPSAVASAEQITDTAPPPSTVMVTTSGVAAFPGDFFTLSGRTRVWAQGWDLLKQSPVLGYGFHADRLMLSRHMHNSYMHALIQTGWFGALPFFAALLLGAMLLARALLRLGRLPLVHKHLVIQTAGVMTILAIRTIPESTGAFFGVDWLLLAPLLLYLQLVNEHSGKQESSQ